MWFVSVCFLISGSAGNIEIARSPSGAGLLSFLDEYYETLDKSLLGMLYYSGGYLVLGLADTRSVQYAFS